MVKKNSNRTLLFVLDEAQVLSSSQQGFEQKLLQLRHHGVHLLSGFQNISCAPIEFVNNSDLSISFRSVGDDVSTFAKTINLTHEQAAMIPRLNRAECVCKALRSGWKLPFFAEVPHLEFCGVDDATIKKESKRFLERFPWKPIKEEDKNGAKGKSPRDEETERFLRDVLNQHHEFSALTERFERSGIRSASRQGQVIRDLCADGYIKVWPLPIGRGRPIKLVQASSKAAEEFNVSWNKTRGILPTRAATEFIWRKLKNLEGWNCIKEGQVGGKQVDILCRDPQGNLVCVEIAGSAEHEVHNALHCVSLTELKKHIVVCLNKKVRDGVMKKFQGMPELTGNQKIEVILLSKALSDSWGLRW